MRYIRQEIFSEIRKSGQLKLKNSAVAIVGLGALGSVSSELLARAGVGKLILIDRDVVELSNLQRQSLYEEEDIGKPKAQAAVEQLKKINSQIEIEYRGNDLNFENIGTLLQNIDLILDCTDNLETRFLLNDFCVKNKMNFIYASAVSSKGYVFNIVSEGPCLRCFLSDKSTNETCENTGVLNSITHLIASVQSNEAIKILLSKKCEKNLLFFNIWENELTKIKIKKNEQCKCCVKMKFEYLDGGISSKIVKLCGQGTYQIKNKPIDLPQIKEKLSKIGKVTNFGNCISFNDKITIFHDGRTLIKAKDEKEAKLIYSKLVGN